MRSGTDRFTVIILNFSSGIYGINKLFKRGQCGVLALVTFTDSSLAIKKLSLKLHFRVILTARVIDALYLNWCAVFKIGLQQLLVGNAFAALLVAILYKL